MFKGKVYIFENCQRYETVKGLGPRRSETGTRRNNHRSQIVVCPKKGENKQSEDAIRAHYKWHFPSAINYILISPR